MKKYQVSLILSIEAKNEEEAIKEFYLRANECAFERGNIEVTEE